MSAIILHIPCLPTLELSINQRAGSHWAQQGRTTRFSRAEAGMILREAWRRDVSDQGLPDIIRPPVELHWTLFWPKGLRSRDAGSCEGMLKSWVDAIVDLGWLENDSLKYVSRISYGGVASSPLGPSMTLEIWQEEA